MLTVEGLNAGAAVYTRRVLLVAVAGFLALVLGMVVAMALCRDVTDDNVRIGNVMILVYTQFPALVLMLGGWPLIEVRATRDKRVSCPFCRRSLITYRHLVIATRNCTHCGRQVLIEPEEPVVPSVSNAPPAD